LKIEDPVHAVISTRGLGEITKRNIQTLLKWPRSGLPQVKGAENRLSPQELKNGLETM
jgi:hypothetical protein